MTKKDNKERSKRLFITPKDVQSTGLMSERQVQKWCKEGKLDALRVGNSWRINLRSFCEMFGIDESEI